MQPTQRTPPYYPPSCRNMRSGGCFTKKTSLFLQLARGDGERETPKDLFPRSLPTKGSEWPEDKGGCVFDFSNAQCPYGDKCSRSHAKNPTKSSPSSAATNGSNSPKMRAIEPHMRRLPAQKERLQLEEEESGIFSSSSEDDDSPARPLPPYGTPSSSRSSGSKN